MPRLFRVPNPPKVEATSGSGAGAGGGGLTSLAAELATAVQAGTGQAVQVQQGSSASVAQGTAVGASQPRRWEIEKPAGIFANAFRGIFPAPTDLVDVSLREAGGYSILGRGVDGPFLSTAFSLIGGDPTYSSWYDSSAVQILNLNHDTGTVLTTGVNVAYTTNRGVIPGFGANSIVGGLGADYRSRGFDSSGFAADQSSPPAVTQTNVTGTITTGLSWQVFWFVETRQGSALIGITTPAAVTGATPTGYRLSATVTSARMFGRVTLLTLDGTRYDVGTLSSATNQVDIVNLNGPTIASMAYYGSEGIHAIHSGRMFYTVKPPSQTIGAYIRLKGLGAFAFPPERTADIAWSDVGFSNVAFTEKNYATSGLAGGITQMVSTPGGVLIMGANDSKLFFGSFESGNDTRLAPYGVRVGCDVGADAFYADGNVYTIWRGGLWRTNGASLTKLSTPLPTTTAFTRCAYDSTNNWIICVSSESGSYRWFIYDLQTEAWTRFSPDLAFPGFGGNGTLTLLQTNTEPLYRASGFSLPQYLYRYRPPTGTQTGYMELTFDRLPLGDQRAYKRLLGLAIPFDGPTADYSLTVTSDNTTVGGFTQTGLTSGLLSGSDLLYVPVPANFYGKRFGLTLSFSSTANRLTGVGFPIQFDYIPQSNTR
jgi:hypothetical protein